MLPPPPPIPLRGALGPSPWAWKNRSQTIGGSRYLFRDFDAADKLSGITRVLNDSGETLLLLEFCCYARFLDDATCLIWWETDSKERKAIEFRLFSCQKLSAIADPVAAAREMREGKETVRGIVESIAFTFSCYRAEGIHSIESPQQFAQFEETLVLADYHPGGNGWDQMFRAIFVFDWVEKSVEIFPQDWFNRGNYDFGYQWITRVARLADGRIVGDGIRLGSFELDASYKQVKTWLTQNPFYMLD